MWRLMGAIAVLVLGVTCASWAQQPAASNQATVFTHPETGFVLTLPLGAEVATGGHHDVQIRSRQGYLITVQTKARQQDVKISDMIARLEAAYLGEGKVWNKRMSSSETRVAGLPALMSTYEGSKTRVRVVLVRGPKTDMVFMFYAPPNAFETLKDEFNWVLAHFQPGPEDRVESPVPAVEPLMVEQGWKIFGDQSVGYTFPYPKEWVIEALNESTVLVGGAAETPEYDVNVSVQTIAPVNRQAGSDMFSMVISDLRRQFATAGARIVHQAAYTHNKGAKGEGYQFSVIYTADHKQVKQYTAVVPRGDGFVFVWSFRAPSARFDAFKDVALKILRNWQILPA